MFRDILGLRPLCALVSTASVGLILVLFRERLLCQAPLFLKFRFATVLVHS